jgi:hypothetical protein
MKSFNGRLVRRVAIAVIGLSALGGCAVVPYNSGYYDQGYGYGAPVYAAPPAVYVAPAFSLGLGYRSGGYYGPRYGGYRGGRW